MALSRQQGRHRTKLKMKRRHATSDIWAHLHLLKRQQDEETYSTVCYCRYHHLSYLAAARCMRVLLPHACLVWRFSYSTALVTRDRRRFTYLSGRDIAQHAAQRQQLLPAPCAPRGAGQRAAARACYLVSPVALPNIPRISFPRLPRFALAHIVLPQQTYFSTMYALLRAIFAARHMRQLYGGRRGNAYPPAPLRPDGRMKTTLARERGAANDTCSRLAHLPYQHTRNSLATTTCLTSWPYCTVRKQHTISYAFATGANTLASARVLSWRRPFGENACASTWHSPPSARGGTRLLPAISTSLVPRALYTSPAMRPFRHADLALRAA